MLTYLVHQEDCITILWVDNMAYIQKGNPFKKRFVKAPGEVSKPSGAAAGQGYFDQLKAQKQSSTSYESYGSLGEIERAQRKRPSNIETSMPAVDVGGTGNFNDTAHGADLGNYHMRKAKDKTIEAAGIKGSVGLGSLSRRQRIRLEKGGPKADRQLARIKRRAERRKRRGRV